MSSSQAAAKNTLYQFLTKIITSLIGLVTRKLLTNYLGPAGFGDYVFILTYSSLFSSIADWGTIVIGVREASQNASRRPEIFGSAILGRFILSLIAFVLALIFSPLISKTGIPYSVVVVSGLLIIVFALKASLGIIFESLLRMDRWMIVESVASIVTLLLFILGYLLNLPLIYFLLFLFIATSLCSFLAFILSQRLTVINLHPDIPLLKHLGSESLPMGAALIMFNIYNRMDTVILRLFRSATEVGFYGLAYFLYENLVLMAAYFIKSVFPVLSRSAVDQNNKSKFNFIYNKTYDLMLFLALSAGVFAYFSAPFIVNIISSPQFFPSIPLLRILSISLVFSYLNHVTGFGLIALGKQRQYSLVTFIALVFNITANVIATPHYGALAAAWITVATEFTVQLCGLYMTYRYTGFIVKPSHFPVTVLEFVKSRGKIF